MSTNNFFKSSLMDVHNMVAASMLVYPKESILWVLRDFFSKDDYYHYSKDKWGFPNAVDQTGKLLGSDLPAGTPGSTAPPNIDLPTRLVIGEKYRFDGIYYPSILVSSGSGRYVPLSINRDQGKIEYENVLYEDGYGNSKIIKRPMYFVTNGIWEGQFSIEVYTKSVRSRDDLIERIMNCFTEIYFETLQQAGLVVKPPSWSGPSEGDDRSDKLFRQTVTLDVRSEWERKIPIGNLIESILFTIDFENISNPNAIPAANLTVNSRLDMVDLILNT